MLETTAAIYNLKAISLKVTLARPSLMWSTLVSEALTWGLSWSQRPWSPSPSVPRYRYCTGSFVRFSCLVPFRWVSFFFYISFLVNSSVHSFSDHGIPLGILTLSYCQALITPWLFLLYVFLFSFSMRYTDSHVTGSLCVEHWRNSHGGDVEEARPGDGALCYCQQNLHNSGKTEPPPHGLKKVPSTTVLINYAQLVVAWK